MELPSFLLLLVYSGVVLLPCSSPGLALYFDNQADQDDLNAREKGSRAVVKRESSISQGNQFNNNSEIIWQNAISVEYRVNSENIIHWEDIVPWGCYNFWTIVADEDETNYGSEVNAQTCLTLCKEESQDVALIRGMQCFCKSWDSISSGIRIRNEYCNSTCHQACPVSASQSICGGNVAGSVYCTSDDERCGPNTNPIGIIDDYKVEVLETYYDQSRNQDILKPIFNSKQCLQCEGENVDPDNGCFLLNNFVESQDYFPHNDPIACVLHCRRKMWFDNTLRTFPVAFITWRAKKEKKYMPYCVCYQDYPSNNTYVEVPEENCTTECPSGLAGSQCGNSQDLTFLSVYCTTEHQPCLPLGQPYYEVTDEPPGRTEPAFPTTTTPQTDDSLKSTTPKTPSTTSTTTTATTITTTITTATTITITTTTTEAHSTEPSKNCSTKCNATVSNRHWEGCPGKLTTKPCRNGATGTEKWYCMNNGVFENAMPDSSNCTTDWYSQVHKDFKARLEKNNQSLTKKDAESLLGRMEVQIRSNDTNTSPYYGHEIKSISDVMREIVNASKVNLEELNKLLSQSMTLVGLLLSNKEPWQDLGEVSLRSDVGMAFFDNLEQSAFTLSKYVNKDYSASHKASSLTTDQFVLNFGAGSNSSEKELFFPLDSSRNSYIHMEEGWANLVSEPEYVGYLVDTTLYDHIFPAQLYSTSTDENQTSKKILNGKLLSLTIKGLPRGNLKGRKVRITFQHHLEAWGNEVQNFPRKLHPTETRKVSLSTAVCVYWSVHKKVWSHDGCKLIQSTATHTVCECNHLTSFAVLMDPHNYMGKDLALEVLTFLLCPISVVCLIACMIVFSAVHAIQCQRTTITKHLCFCLTIGIILVIFFVDRNYLSLPTGVCIAVGIVTHYIYLAAFVWMAIEGVHLYKMVVHVFDSGRSHTTTYRVTAYGIPVLIVGTTCVVGFLLQHQPYGGEMYCWLVGAYIWCFMIPVALIVMANMIILFVALKTAIQMKTTTTHLQERQRNYKSWIRGSFSITVLLGLTWMPGFVLTLNSPVVVQVASYIFVFLNASQGIFLFIFNCFLNEKVRRAAGRNLGLPSWLSMSPPQSKEGRRSENNREHSFEYGKGEPEAWRQNSSRKEENIAAFVIPRNRSGESDPYHNDLAYHNNLQATNSNSDMSTSSQKALSSNKWW